MALTDPWSGRTTTPATTTRHAVRQHLAPRRRARAALRRRTRAAGRAVGRPAALLFPSLIVRTWHHRPGRGPVRPDKETA